MCEYVDIEAIVQEMIDSASSTGAVVSSLTDNTHSNDGCSMMTAEDCSEQRIKKCTMIDSVSSTGAVVSSLTNYTHSNDGCSMTTAEDCSEQRIKKCKRKTNKAVKRAKRSKTNRAMRNKLCPDPCKDLPKKKKLTKKTKRRKTKMISKKESYLCDRCRFELGVASCEPLEPAPTPCPRQGVMRSTQTSPRSKRQIEPNELNLLLDLNTKQVNANFDGMMMCNVGTDIQREVVEAQNKLAKQFLEIQKRLAREQMSPCYSCCRCRGCSRCNPWEAVTLRFRQAFCNPCCCHRCKSSRRCSESPARCSTCESTSHCVSRQTSQRSASNRSGRYRDLLFKSRSWLLEKNEQLEARLSKLRAEEKKTCGSCAVNEGHYSSMLWQMLMESLVKALVESHPSIEKQEDKVCQCRLQHHNLC